MLEIKGLTKTYKFAKAPAVQDVSFNVKNGEIFGIVGKNGAGKSTILKCVLGIHPYQEGSIILNGIDLKKEENKFKKCIGYVPDNHMVYESLTGREYINFMADVYGEQKADRAYKIEEYAKMFDLDEAIDKQISGYSHGMRQKICIIGALIHNPNLWVLDEPFLGLDYKSVTLLKQNIKKFTQDEKHIALFSSHDLDVVIEICNRVCVIENGKVVDILRMSNAKHVEKLKKLMM